MDVEVVEYARHEVVLDFLWTEVVEYFADSLNGIELNFKVLVVNEIEQRRYVCLPEPLALDDLVRVGLEVLLEEQHAVSPDLVVVVAANRIN